MCQTFAALNQREGKHTVEKKDEEIRKERDFINAVLETAGSLVVVLDTDGLTLEDVVQRLMEIVEGSA